jgi:NADH dehydrogenase/NADH:ubiquinone oxidoreductase subunit G
MEAALINARIRKSVVHFGLEVSSIGPAFDPNYPVNNLGDDLSLLDDEKLMESVFKGAENPMIVVGLSALKSNENVALIESRLRKLAQKYPLVSEDWNGINFLQTAAGRVGALDLGLVPGTTGSKYKDVAPKVVFLLGADEWEDSEIPEDAFVIYQGSHGDKGAQRADLILPSTAWTEKRGVYVNTEGRVQIAEKAVDGPEEARDDWQIIRALSEFAGAKLPYDDVDGVRARIAELAPQFVSDGEIEESSISFAQVDDPSKVSATIPKQNLEPYFKNFWFTDNITRNSLVLAQCSEQLPKSTNSYV